MRVLCCNIRYSAAPDGPNAWAHRKAFCAQVILSREPDIVCFQEMSCEQYLYLREAMPEYDAYGVVDRPLGYSRQNTIFWLQRRFNLLSAGGYWLSATPHVPGSKSWDSQNIRQANWVMLGLVGSGACVRIVDTHLDHIGQTAREQQARLVNEDAAAYPEWHPQVLCGDMNADATNPAILSFFYAGWKDTYEIVHGERNPGPTYHGFLGQGFQGPMGKIDWIFSRGRLATTAAEIIRDERDGHYPSDHYFLSADLEFT